MWWNFKAIEILVLLNNIFYVTTYANINNISLLHGRVCPFGYFQCNDNISCVEQYQNCNDVKDCSDGSDEWHCDDYIDSLFWDHLFRKRPAARLDDLDNNECGWKNLSDTLPCLCRRNELLCQNKFLTNLPNNLPQENRISLLDLSGNYFSNLNESFFENLQTSVDVLVLKHCSIKQISSKTFFPFDELNIEVLYLNENKIKDLPEILFPKNNKLQSLILAGNYLQKFHHNVFYNLILLTELDLRNNEIETINAEVLKPLVNLKMLYLNENRISALAINMIPWLENLLILSLSNNRIREISSNALNLSSLENLFLSGNNLHKLQENTFINLPNLLGLNLNDNEIDEIQLGSFNGIENLQSLYLERNHFKTLNPAVMRNLSKLNYIYFSSFHLCNAARHVRVCEPQGDGISSTNHLLDNIVLRISVWIMSAIGILGNFLVLIGKLLAKSKRMHGQIEHSLYLHHLAISDFIMAVYLLIIAIADMKFRGKYLTHEEMWRTSFMCSVCGMLNTISYQSSTLLLTLITWDRLISVTHPLQPRSSYKKRAIIRLGILWSYAIIAAILPLTIPDYFGYHFYGSNGVCLSLHIHDPYAQGWQYSIIMFVLLNIVSLVFIAISYLKMLKAIRGSGEALRSTLSGRENSVTRRFALIVASNWICWLPIITVKLLALGGVNISPVLYAWLAVLILPVNSALNPILYTLTTADFIHQLNRCFGIVSPCSSVHGNELQNRQKYGSDQSVSMAAYIPSHGIPVRKHQFLRRV